MILQNVNMSTKVPMSSKGKQLFKPVNKDRYISTMFLSKNSVTMVLNPGFNPWLPPTLKKKE
uniref:Uncharacterized protein n=1 Tax=Urocitellus parryii TaxID=9999 RepID=A0A8D2HHU7_UROPR